MFAEWEGWNYLDSVYFCVTSLAKIGFGDFVPGRSQHIVYDLENNPGKELGISAATDAQIKLVITFVYILLGMAIVSMCYHLLKEEVLLNLKRLREAMRKKAETFQKKYMTFTEK